MYAISTPALVFILALASSLAVVIQATPVRVCTGTVVAKATTCEAQALLWGYNAGELAAWMFAYNDNVHLDCRNLIINQTVRIFLLQTRLYTRGVTKD